MENLMIRVFLDYERCNAGTFLAAQNFIVYDVAARN